MKKSSLFVLLGIIILSSCSRGKVFEKYTDIKGYSWNRFDVIGFQVDIKDISPAYDFYVEFRRMDQCPFKSITIDFTFSTPSGETRSSEHRIDFVDKSGKPLGNGMGDLWDVEKLVREGYKFTEPGTCKVEVSSTMPYVDLPGIMQVGLIVRKSR